jgi:hypothetical protein
MDAHHRLSLLQRQGNWTTLKHLNRPAVLELIDGRGRKHYVAAMEIEGPGRCSSILRVVGSPFPKATWILSGSGTSL